MYTITIRHVASEDERIASTAFDYLIGSTVRVTFEDGPLDGVLTAVEIADDGRSAELTVEVPDGQTRA